MANSGSSGKRASGFVESPSFDSSAASGLPGMTSGSSSGLSVLPVPKSAGIVEGAVTSFKEEIVLDQQLMKAFQTVFATHWMILIMTPCPTCKKYVGGIHVSDVFLQGVFKSA